jgi:hypothetical protein
VASYTLTLRRRGEVTHQRLDTLSEALDALEARVGELTPPRHRRPEHALVREIEPVAQVAVRGEISGRGVRGGVDVRGDGSLEAFTGRLRRVVVAAQPGESAFDALRRALAG